MSSSFNTIRKHTSDPNALRIKQLAQELAKQRSDNTSADLESEDIRSQGRMDHSTIKINDERLKFLTTIPVNHDLYEMPFEPDGDKLKLWLMMDHLGRRIQDASGFQHNGILLGHPTMHRSPLDMGFMQTSASPAFPAMSFNTALDSVGNPTGEHIQVVNHPDLQFSQFSNGFSVAFRFNCVDFSFDTTSGSFNRRFASKQDDPDNHWVVIFDVTGDIDFQVTDNGVLYKRDFDNLQLNTWYQTVMTYDPSAGSTSADRIKIYVDGIEGSSASGVTLIPPPPQIRNLYIGARTASTAFFRGFIQDFRIYMDKVLTQQEVTNLNNNELSISDIPKGKVFVINYALINEFTVLRTHSYAIGKVVVQTRHKYNIIGTITRTKTHKYNIRKLVLRTRTHKFNILQKVTQTKTHKYGMGGTLTAFRTHRYAMGGVLTQTKTHKFNMLQAVTATKTHKFNLVQTTAKTEVVRFTKSTSLSTPVAQEITFQDTPQAIVVWSDGSTSADNAFTDNYHVYYGFSDGTRHACISGLSRDNLATSDTFSGHKNNKVIAMMNNTVGVVSAEADVSFSTNKATFNWTTNDNRAVPIYCMAIYGVDDACVQTYEYGSTTTGNKVYNLPAGHTSTVGKFIHTITMNGTPLLGWNTAYGNAVAIGAATSSTARWAVSNMAQDAATVANTARSHVADKVIHCFDDDAVAIDASADFISFGTGTFTINVTTAPPATNRGFSVLVIDDPNIAVGSITQPSSTGTQVINTATNVDDVQGAMFFGNQQSTSGTSGTAAITIGGASGTAATEQGLTLARDNDGADPTVSVRQHRNNMVIKSVSATATASSSTTSSQADVNAFGTDQFTLSWANADGVGRVTYYWVIGDT